MSNINDFEIKDGKLCQYKNTEEQEVVIPDGVETICSNAFQYRWDVKTITVPASVTQIEEGAFGAPRNLEGVYFSDLTSFMNIAFGGDIWRWKAGPDLYINGELIEDITIPEGVISLGNNSFAGWKSIKSITIPKSIKSIGDEAFYNCQNLDIAYFSDIQSFLNVKFGESVWASSRVNLYFDGKPATDIVIPEDITCIDGHIFRGFKNIVNITIPEKTTIEGNFDFYGCKSLERIIIPNGITTIGKFAFSGCSSLKSVTIPESVTSIEDDAFSGCISLDAIEIPDSVTKIGRSAFMDSSLTRIKLPGGLNTISWGLFMRCGNLKSVAIPEGVKRIEENAFSNCSSLESITIPKGVKSIGEKAFEGCDRLKEINAISVSTIGSNACSPNTVVVLKKYIKDIEKNRPSQRLVFCKTPIQEIKSTDAKRLAIYGFLTVKELSVYDQSVIESYKKFLKGKVINYRDFILENNIELIIRRLALLGLIDSKLVDKMMEQDVSDDIKMLLSEYAKDSGKKSTSKETAGKKAPSVTELKKVWSYKKNEEGLTITSYKDVDTKIIVPEMIGKDIVTVIDNWAFSPRKSGLNEAQHKVRSSLEEVVLPNTVTSINNGAFSRCYNLIKVTIPDGVAYIGGAAFEDCRQLKDITIPDSVEAIGSSAFAGCSSLESIIIPDGVKVIDSYVFAGCEKLSKIQLPNNLKEIRYDAFKKCTNLTEITIPSSVTKVYSDIFEECKSLKSVILPSGLKKVEFFMFNKCTGLTDVTIMGSDTSIDETAFNGCSNFTIHAPAGSSAEKFAKKNKIPFEVLD